MRAPQVTAVDSGVRPDAKLDYRLMLGAVGVVFGDIGTSPLYAFKECLSPMIGLSPTRGDVIGVLSLIIWAMTVTVTFKYVTFVMRADNRGEGGILALTALALRSFAARGQRTRLAIIGMLGAALFYGDSMITPAISVLSAVEGLKIINPDFGVAVVPISLVLLTGLFMIQRRGTAKVGALFGPVMLLWFVVLGLLGLRSIWHNPEVLAAFNPLEGIAFAIHKGPHTLLILGAVVLAVTGVEALYADMGHFGRTAIRLSWVSIAMPALLLNYLGQGALVLRDPSTIGSPFFLLAPEVLQPPLFVLAMAATIIASQAVISGAFSLTQQAVQLGYLPRVTIRHTSLSAAGQIYVPEVNLLLLIGVSVLVLTFQSSDALAAAYGLAVIGTMMATSTLAYVVARGVGLWSRIQALPLMVIFLGTELAYLAGNLPKILDGGWLTLLVAAVCFGLMLSWFRGRRLVHDAVHRNAPPLSSLLKKLESGVITRVPGIAVFLARVPERTPHALAHNFAHNHVLHETAVIVHIAFTEEPSVHPRDRLQVTELGHGVWKVLVRFGFMETPDVPLALELCAVHGLDADPHSASYFLSNDTFVPCRATGLKRWQEVIFLFLYNTAVPATRFFNIPVNRVVELGQQIEI